MKRIILNLFLLGAIFSVYSCGSSTQTDSNSMAKDSNNKKLDDTMATASSPKTEATVNDAEKFAVDAADGGMLEVQLGKLAATKGSSKAVKDFGKMMVKDHSKANNELKALAKKKNITLPASLGNSNQKKYDDLAAKSGSDFDKAYSSAMVDDHKEDIDLFKKEAEKGDDPDLKTWAAGKLSILEHHLMMAQKAKDMTK